MYEISFVALAIAFLVLVGYVVLTGWDGRSGE